MEDKSNKTNKNRSSHDTDKKVDINNKIRVNKNSRNINNTSNSTSNVNSDKKTKNTNRNRNVSNSTNKETNVNNNIKREKVVKINKESIKNKKNSEKNTPKTNDEAQKNVNNIQIENKQKNNKKRKKRRVWTKIVIVILLAIITFVIWFFYKTKKNGGGLSGMLATVVGHDENTKKNLPELKMLILGVSTDLGEDAPTDTIMVASYNPNTQKANLISIPRDTYIGKNKNKANPADKINGLYSFGGIEKILNSVNEITGLDIKHYAVVKNEALIKLVDAIGEVEFNVPINMVYDDPTQNLHINLKEGTQMIDGEKAEQLLRYRHGNHQETYPEEYGDNDTGRMRTQREFIMAVMQQTLKPENIFKIGEILDIANKYLETNLDIAYLKDYIPYAVEFSTENMQTETLPGVNDQLPPKTANVTDRYWFFIHNEKETKDLMQKLFQSQSTDKINDNQTGNQIGTSTTNNIVSNTVTNTNISKSEITIEVLNGSGNDSKLQKAVDLLKDNGYNVTKTGKTSEISKTIITNKKELESETVKEIKQILGNGSISNNKNLSSKVHATVVIGKDFE